MKIYGEYSSNDETITHDGTILGKNGINYEEIKFKISFDITIEIVSGTKFTGRIEMELPREDITTKGMTDYKKTNFNDVIFKRN